MAPFVVALALHYTIGEADLESEQWSWRLLLGLGVVPSLMVLVFTDLSGDTTGGTRTKQSELLAKDEKEAQDDEQEDQEGDAQEATLVNDARGGSRDGSDLSALAPPQRETALQHLRANPATLKCLV